MTSLAPPQGHTFTHGPGHAIWIDRPGGDTRVRSWCPGGPQFGHLVTHNEALSIADYYPVRQDERAVYRPTCHYAYNPCNDAILSLHEVKGAGRTDAPFRVPTNAANPSCSRADSAVRARPTS